MSTEYWPEDRAFDFPHAINMQWKGTDVAMDFLCACNTLNRYCGMFCQFINCAGCQRVHWLNNTVEIVLLTARETHAVGRQRAYVLYQDRRVRACTNETRVPRKKVWPIRRAHVQLRSAFLHYNGMEVCMDFHCPRCRSDNQHIDGRGAQFIGCSRHECERLYWLSPYVQAIELTNRERARLLQARWKPRNPVGLESPFEG